MSIGPRLDLRQSQQLVMTPQLQQAIKLLALTNLELEAYIGEELDRNPLLDTAADDSGGGDEPGEAPPVASAEDSGADQLIADGNATADAPLDVDYGAETFHHDSPSDSVGGEAGPIGGASTASGTETPDFDSYAASEASLVDLLGEQAGAAFDGADLIIARHLIDLIDESGYLIGNVEEVAERLGANPDDVGRVLAVIHTFEPSGVGARSLSECLMIQAREADRLDPAMHMLLRHLDLLARGDLAGLRRLCGVDQEDLSDMIRELRAYNPKPGLRYGGERMQAVIADVFVTRGRGGWRVELNAATLPRVLVDRRYYAELSRGGTKATKTFLTDCLLSANWLVKALDQRATTIVKVATELVKQQEAFFEAGVHHLRPLTLRTIAEAIGMHESTVSRVTSNKYLQCERGLFELKYFFTSAIQSADGGDAVSASAVRDRIARLIGAEPPHDTLSDDRLVEMLRGEGFDIARRTVAKYREGLGIGSSVARRRAKLLETAA
ncbi:RNA polymerase factor sigma-54 [Glacieibacterium sp.]|uniref:RNA polymerase factor sigma-54 n=1 Tax=Glacieibacterium sp. TaxID=2860237 RepID=UPI003B0009BC